MSARPDYLGAGFDLALEEESDSLGLSRVGLDHDTLARPLPRDPLLPTDRVLWNLPGHGVAGESCGRRTYFGHRAPNGETHYRSALRRCGRASCPTCALAPGGWASREADAITARVLAGRPKVARSPIHLVVAPAPEFWPKFYIVGDYPKVRNEANRQAVRKGLRGAAWIFHSARMPTGRWAEKKDGEPAHTRDHCVDGPHYHAIGYGWMGASHPDDERWVVWNLGSRPSLRSVRATAFYCLTHAGTSSLPTAGISPMPDLSHRRGPFETVTWTGILSYRMKIHVPDDPKPVRCAVCGVKVPQKEWYRLTRTASGPPLEPSGVCVPSEWRAVELDATAGYGGRVWVEVEV